MITIDERQDYPAGRYALAVRTQQKDRKLIQAAAQQIGMPMAAFVRTVCLEAAKQVLDRKDC